MGRWVASNLVSPERNDGENASRPRSSATLIEERITISGNGENGKVVISSIKNPSDIEDEGSPLL